MFDNPYRLLPTEKYDEHSHEGRDTKLIFTVDQKRPAGRVAYTGGGRVLEGRDPEWLWPGMIQRGNVTIIEGEPGAGKSFVALDLLARYTREHGDTALL